MAGKHVEERQAAARAVKQFPVLLAALKAALPLVRWAVSDVEGNEGYEDFPVVEQQVCDAIAAAEEGP